MTAPIVFGEAVTAEFIRPDEPCAACSHLESRHTDERCEGADDPLGLQPTRCPCAEDGGFVSDAEMKDMMGAMGS